MQNPRFVRKLVGPAAGTWEAWIGLVRPIRSTSRARLGLVGPALEAATGLDFLVRVHARTETGRPGAGWTNGWNPVEVRDAGPTSSWNASGAGDAGRTKGWDPVEVRDVSPTSMVREALRRGPHAPRGSVTLRSRYIGIAFRRGS